MKTIGQKIIVKVKENEDEQPVEKINGLTIPLTPDKEEKYEEATVISIGEQASKTYPEINEGSKILITKGSGVKVKIDETEYRVIYADNILIVL